MTVNVASGTWGHVKTTAESGPSGWTVSCWINAIPRPRMHGLTREEALEIAAELCDSAATRLMFEFENYCHRSKVVAEAEMVFGRFCAADIDAITAKVNYCVTAPLSQRILQIRIELVRLANLRREMRELADMLRARAS